MICETCGNDGFHDDKVTDSFVVSGKLVLVEDIPARVCDRCGSANFTSQVAEQLRKMIHEPHQPLKTVQAEVMEFRAA